MPLTKEQIKSLETDLCYRGVITPIYSQLFDELCEYKKIEEELGINLVILFGALKNGVYYFEGNQITHDKVYLYNNYLGVCFDKLSYSFMTFFRKYLFDFKDYGKTWALTKEELLCD